MFNSADCRWLDMDCKRRMSPVVYVLVTLMAFAGCSTPLAAQYFEHEYEGGPLARKHQSIVFDDDFESGGWRANKYSGDPSGSGQVGVLWMHSQLQGPYSGKVVSAPHPVRHGKHSMRFEWRPENSKGSNTTKKAMLHGPKISRGRGMERWYGFSVYLPKDGMAVDSHPMLFFQLHATPDRDKNEPWRQPIAAMRIDPKGMVFCDWTYDTAPVSPKNKNIVKNRTTKLISHVSKWWDRWIDVVWRVRFDPFGAGLVQIWINGRQIVDQRTIPVGYHDKLGAYPSYGLYYYAGKGDRTHWIYFDDIRTGNEEASFSAIRSAP